MGAAWKPKPCHGCGAEKPAGMGRGVMYCPACLIARERGEHDLRTCHCGAPKPTGRGRRVCDTCRDREKPRGVAPCHACGTTKDKQPRCQYCDECRELRKWRERARRHALWETQKRKRCSRCGKQKGAGRRRRLCDACRAAKGPSYRCVGCGEKNLSSPLARRCVRCKAETVERRRARHRAYQAQYRASGPSPDRALTARQRRAEAERRRMEWRLRREREGTELADIRALQTDSGSLRVDERGRLPAGPLVAALDRAWRRATAGNPYDDLPGDTSVYNRSYQCEQCGITDRTLRRWQVGEITEVQFGTVDSVLTGLGLNWWDVYTGDNAALAQAVFEGEGHLVAA